MDTARATVRGKGIVVTGASRGLGKALAIELAKRGGRVVMVARGEAELATAVAEARAAAAGSGGVAHGLAFDVGDKEAVHRIAGAAAALVDVPIEVLVNNASTLGPLPMPLLLDTDCEALEAVLAVNLLGPFRLTKALAGSMALAEHGVVVFLSSDTAVNAYPTWGAYGVSKAAQDHLARVFAAELPKVRFYAVDPTDMDTAMHAAAIPDADPSTLARPEEIARRIAWLIEHDEVASGARVSAADLGGDAASSEAAQ